MYYEIPDGEIVQGREWDFPFRHAVARTTTEYTKTKRHAQHTERRYILPPMHGTLGHVRASPPFKKDHRDEWERGGSVVHNSKPHTYWNRFSLAVLGAVE